MTRLALPLVLLGLLGALGIFLFSRLSTTTYIASDRVFAGDYQISQGKRTVVKNGAKVTVEGNLKVQGKLECENGALNLEVKKDVTIEGVINCQRNEDADKEGEAVNGIALIVKGNFAATGKSVIASNSHIQVVESADLLLKTPEDIEKAYQEAGEDSGEKMRIGPFVPEAAGPVSYSPSSQPQSETVVQPKRFSIIENVNAQGAIKRVGDPNLPLPEVVDVKKVPRGTRLVIILFRMPNGTINLSDGVMLGPDGQDGVDVKGGCNINIPKNETKAQRDEKNGMRMRAHARVIRVNNYYLFLGDGGRGGNAETDKDCDPGIAIAGDGGEPANMKWTALEYIDIAGDFYLYPGKGGDGGKAIAYGKNGADGNPGKKGADAGARGGKGADNKRTLKATGDVRGLEKIFVGPMIAGDGGEAIVNPGKGGNGNVCDAKGGPGGRGVARGGKGGKISLSIPRGVKRVSSEFDRHGKDAPDLNKVGERGQDGPPCQGDAAPTPTPQKKTETAPRTDYAQGDFEFIDLATGQKVIGISVASNPHIIVATNGNPDVRGWLPIKIEVKVDGKTFWTGTIQGDPSQVCRGSTGCSMNGPKMPSNWQKIEVFAYDKNSQLVASFFETYKP